MKTYFGVDLGGTNVRVAIIAEDGSIIEEIKRPSLSDQGPEVVLDNIIDMAQTLKGHESCLGMGIGIPGPVDTAKGCVSLSTNLKGFTGYPVVEYLSKHFNIPIYLDNDANVAGLAEALVGAGAGNPIVYYVTHSTGIGGALVVNGKTVSGRKGYAGEVGNIVIDRDRSDQSDINSLNIGAVENEASGSAMVRKAQKLLEKDITSAKRIFQLADEGNPIALKLIDDMAYDFASVLASIAHVVDPHVFVLGGGVTLARDYYWPKMIEYYQSLVHPQMRDVPFKEALLEEPGIIGAAMLCR